MTDAEKDIVEQLSEEEVRLARQSFDCQNCGISSNLTREVADTITTLRAEVEEWKGNWQQAAANGVKDSARADKAESERDAAILRAEKAEAELVKVRKAASTYHAVADSILDELDVDPAETFVSIKCNGSELTRVLLSDADLTIRASLTEGE